MRLKIELEPVKPFVALRHLRFHSLADLVAAMDRIIETGGHDGVRVDYLDGVVFSADESYLCLGVQTADAGPGQRLHRPGHLLPVDPARPTASKDDRLTIHDYLWRWDTDWFWCSRAFGAQNPTDAAVLATALPAQQLLLEAASATTSGSTSPTGSRRATAARRASAWCRTSRCRSSGPREFLDWFLADVPIEPIWLCPLRLRDAGGWPLYPTAGRAHLRQHRLLVVGAGRRRAEGDTNRLIEAKVSELDGHKSLYSDAYYTRDEFDELYGGETYKTVKKTYDPDSRLLDLYAKAVQRR